MQLTSTYLVDIPKIGKRKMGLRQMKDFPKSFLANEWWRWDDNSTRLPGSRVGGEANGEGQLGRVEGWTHWMVWGAPQWDQLLTQAGGRRTQTSRGYRSCPRATASLFLKV